MLRERCGDGGVSISFTQERAMAKVFRCGIFVLAFIAAPLAATAQAPTPPAGTTTPPSVTNAQGQVQLSPAQKAAIRDAIQQKGTNAPPSIAFRAEAGEMVPPSIELYPLPDSAVAQAPDAKNLKFTMVESTVVLVDPLNMRVVDTIAK
jgi:hypothetical protein